MGLWLVFSLCVLGLLILDLAVFHRHFRPIKTKEALLWSLLWIGLALAFNFLLYLLRGKTVALQFFTGYLLEKSLSVDNLFVFILLFASFKVPPQYRHKILYWGIIGALLMRLGFILAGSALINRFHWIIYLLGAFLAFSGIKLLLFPNRTSAPQKNLIVRLFKRFFPVTEEFHGGRFFFKGKATPLFLTLLAVETLDLVFAVDSIPAIFAITTDPFIVYTSNVFAILGLRALYFVVADWMDRFRYLKVGLSLILVFIGIKMLISPFYLLPIEICLGVILVILMASLLLSRKKSA